MKSVLIVYSKMIVGGSTTSLLGLLNNFDYKNYQVSLLLNDLTGVLQDQIPKQVNILSNLPNVLQSIDTKYLFNYIKARVLSIVKRNDFIRSQIMSAEKARISARIEHCYDIAIAFLEFWPSQYVYQRVTAAKKILWIHTDYASIIPSIRYDEKIYSSADKVVLVSPKCLENFIRFSPRNASKTVCIPNLLSSATIKKLANVPINFDYTKDDTLRIVTVARIAFGTKGHDRGLNVLMQMKQSFPLKKFVWYIIGDGPDAIRLSEMIRSLGMQDNVLMMGEMINPHPYVKLMDVFFLPSRFEGKPMAVTEAQMNGVVPFVTRYASAPEQIKNMVDGVICDNNDSALLNTMKHLFEGRIDLDNMKAILKSKDYSNNDEIKKVYAILEE